MDLRTHPKANIDFFESYFYYETASEGLGERFYDEVKEAYRLITLSPLKYKIINRNYRVYYLSTFPFQVVYIFNQKIQLISISSIHHNSKNPKKRFRKF